MGYFTVLYETDQKKEIMGGTVTRTLQWGNSKTVGIGRSAEWAWRGALGHPVDGGEPGAAEYSRSDHNL